MATTVSRKGKVRFAIGVALIVISYAFFGMTFVCGALAIGDPKGLWKLLIVWSYVLSWVFFLLGLLLAGNEAVKLVRGKLISPFWRRKTGVPPADEKPAAGKD